MASCNEHRYTYIDNKVALGVSSHTLTYAICVITTIGWLNLGKHGVGLLTRAKNEIV